jgi:flagellar biosynthetic protein FliP
MPVAGFAQEVDVASDGLGLLNFFQNADQTVRPDTISNTLLIFFLLTILTLAPSVLVMTTSFTRIIVVFGFLRQAMATQQSPPNQVLVGLALFLTAFVMMPTYERVYNESLQPYMNGDIETFDEAWNLGIQPIRDFMFLQVEKNPKDLALFIEISQMNQEEILVPETPDDVSTWVLIPAFIIGELRAAFILGFVIYIPFLIIDMVVASTLMAMGMMMLPPVFVSLPFKIILFVLVDGWYLLIGSLVRSFY